MERSVDSTGPWVFRNMKQVMYFKANPDYGQELQRSEFIWKYVGDRFTFGSTSTGEAHIIDRVETEKILIEARRRRSWQDFNE